MNVMESGEPVLNQTWWVPNVRTGDVHWYSSSKICLRSRDGRVIGIAGIMRPIEHTDELTADHRHMTAVAAHIETHFDEKLTLEELAEVAGYSPRHFQRVFKQIFKTSAIEHLLRVRIRHAAARLVETKDDQHGRGRMRISRSVAFLQSVQKAARNDSLRLPKTVRSHDLKIRPRPAYESCPSLS